MSVERDPADAALGALLRAHAHEVPPPHLDAAILAAAHRAIGSAPRSTESAEATRPWGWWMPIAAAAAIGAMAISVLQLVPSEHEPTIVTDMPASVDARRDNATVGSESAPIIPRAAPEQTAPPLTAPLRDKSATDRSEARTVRSRKYTSYSVQAIPMWWTLICPSTLTQFRIRN